MSCLWSHTPLALNNFKIENYNLLKRDSDKSDTESALPDHYNWNTEDMFYYITQQQIKTP